MKYLILVLCLMQLMQPSFALVCDKRTKCFLLFIRGAISTKERLTAATAAEVPFHHISLSEGQIKNVVLGYAHCGMLVAARWIAALVIPHLHSKLQEFPDFQIKVTLTNVNYSVVGYVDETIGKKKSPI